MLTTLLKTDRREMGLVTLISQSSACAVWRQPYFISSTSETLEPVLGQATDRAYIHQGEGIGQYEDDC